MSSQTTDLYINSFPFFMEKVLEYLTQVSIDISGLQIDHAGLRFKSSQDADEMKRELCLISVGSAPLSSETVGGREISVFKLNKPLVYRNFFISCIELMYPGIEHPFKEDGWEHIEVVLPNSNLSGDYEKNFLTRYPKFDPKSKNVDLFKLHIPDVKGQLPNPTIIVQKYLGLAIKFHPSPIEEIVTTKI
jgi:uncharacterized protein